MAPGMNSSPPDSSDPNLRRKVARGAAFNIAGQASRFGVNIVSLVILARLLNPTDFGLVAMVTVVIRFASLFKDFGLATATIQRERISTEQINASFWINTAMSITIAGLIATTAPLVAIFFNDSRLSLITVFLATTVAITGLGVQHRALLERNLRHPRVVIADVIAQFLAMITAILIAWQEGGYWALVAIPIVQCSVASTLYWTFSGWLPSSPWRRVEGIGSIIRFGVNLTGTQFVNFFSRNFDSVLIGKILGTSPLGLYDQAYRLMLWPVMQMTQPLTSVSISGLSRVQTDPARYRNGFVQLVSLLSIVAIPAGVCFFILAEDIVLFLLGNEWREAGPIFRGLSLAALAQPITRATGVLFISMGRADRMLRASLVSACFAVVAFTIGLKWGTVGIAYAYGIYSCIQLGPLFWYATRFAPVSFSDATKPMLRPCLVAATIAGTIISLPLALSSLTEGGGRLAVLLPAAGLVWYTINFLTTGKKNPIHWSEKARH